MSGIVVTAANAMRARDQADDPFPPRAGCAVEPLIEAAEMFPELERLALEATEHVWLAFRIFDPATRLHSGEAKALGLADWGELIGHIAGKGVAVRIMLADFEPVMADYLHAGSWRAFRRLKALQEAEDGRVQVMVIEHAGEIGWAWRQLLRLPLRSKTRRVIAAVLAEEGAIDARPGLWRNVRWEGAKALGWKASAPPRLWPATFHHKFALFDGRTAIVGGIDVNNRRYDDADHDQRADQTWHDISCRLTGPVVADAARHYARLWNSEAPRAKEIAEYWSEGAPEAIALGEIGPLAEPDTDLAETGSATAQLLRTRSCRNDSAFAFGPHANVRELKAAHALLFGSARKRLYVEAQFFRSNDAARWLAAALKASPALEVIILIANTPEEIAFEGQGSNPAHRHGEYLQARALKRVVKAGGAERVGLFTLARDARAKGKEREFAEDRGTAFGSGLIHIHSKLVIADDDAVLLSSANINGRSFEWDTELGVLWQQPGEAIARFRGELWQALSQGELDEKASLADWQKLAFSNARRDPEDRAGFVIPYQIGRARRFGRPAWFVPDDLV
ncbi:hypothetical protein D1610_05905 [Sphingomonas gilva]|uniref:Phospholipase D n=1 Tax=Sphingomonas gilva TaxID=2305907 RepID=A0A396RNS7_9SPHN|nr:phospholipase D-like domain-containing protein [Sphingomonas gilva]RHW18029.1 hypothetical protein D1610_05905 [Sphingomonas gilva]